MRSECFSPKGHNRRLSSFVILISILINGIHIEVIIEDMGEDQAMIGGRNVREGGRGCLVGWAGGSRGMKRGGKKKKPEWGNRP